MKLFFFSFFSYRWGTGRGLQEHVINDRFASLSESLYIAERNAREEVEKRNQIARKLMIREKEKVSQCVSFSFPRCVY